MGSCAVASRGVPVAAPDGATTPWQVAADSTSISRECGAGVTPSLASDLGEDHSSVPADSGAGALQLRRGGGLDGVGDAAGDPRDDPAAALAPAESSQNCAGHAGRADRDPTGPGPDG
eukprot:scaffold8474_cov258-Pinguiococcus_pyrenoidosus.AAC.1